MIALFQVLTVAEYLNFRHAASVLGVSQSSVSARVKALEEELGVPLFERHARGVRLTQAGRHTIDGIAAALDQLDYTIKSAGMLARGERGQLRIGVHALIPGSFFSKLLHLYREQYPDIEVQIIEDTARDALTQLRTGQLDIAFVVGMPELPDCHSRRSWAEPLVAALPERHRHADHTSVTWADIAKETFLVRHGGTGPQVYDHIVQRLAGRCYAPSSLRLAVERSTILSMVEQGWHHRHRFGRFARASSRSGLSANCRRARADRFLCCLVAVQSRRSAPQPARSRKEDGWPRNFVPPNLGTTAR